MANDAINFGRWHATDGGVISQAPDIEGVIQFKALDRLLTYPRGKSAMILYTCGPSCRAVLVDVLDTVTDAFPDDTVVWRFRASNSSVDECGKLLARFHARFGSTPKVNELGITESNEVL